MHVHLLQGIYHFICVSELKLVSDVMKTNVRRVEKMRILEFLRLSRLGVECNTWFGPLVPLDPKLSLLIRAFN